MEKIYKKLSANIKGTRENLYFVPDDVFNDWKQIAKIHPHDQLVVFYYVFIDNTVNNNYHRNMKSIYIFRPSRRSSDSCSRD